MEIFRTLKLIKTSTFNFFLGLVFITIHFAFILLSAPVYIYRWIVCNVIATYWKPEIGKPLNTFGTTYGAEFINTYFHNGSSRCAMVTSSILQGDLPFEAIMEDLEKKWIKAEEDSLDGKVNLRYPEFQQYIESWMGFLFWKQDFQFNLKNHVKHHVLNSQHADPEQYVTTLIETLVNKPFPIKRSPWEVHVVSGYRNKTWSSPLDEDQELYCHREDVDHTGSDGENMTVFIFRLHHALADGAAVLSAQMEGLLGLSLESHINSSTSKLQRKNTSVLEKIFKMVEFPVTFIYDLGCLIGLTFHPQINSPWHIPDENKQGKQIYGRTPLIPTEKIGFIKRNLGVSFTSVLFSCLSAALSDNLKTKNKEKFGNKIPFLPVTTTLPLPRSSKNRYKLTNCLTGTILDLPIDPNLNSEERLEKTEECFKIAKRRTIPLFINFFVKTMASHLAVVANAVFYNKIISVGVSNFPGPTFPAYWMGKKLLNSDVTVGCLPGDCGVCFMALSLGEHFRISITAENAVISGSEMDALINRTCKEIDTLYRIAKKEQKTSVESSFD